MPVVRIRTASARSRKSRAEFLKSAVAAPRTAKYKSGLTNRKILFDSITAFSALASSLRMRGTACASIPCRVRTHIDQIAPAARNLAVSVPLVRLRSSLTAIAWSSVSQTQGSPFAEQKPCPYCVILNAVQRCCGKRAIRLATAEVLPILREWPPMTTIAKA